MKIKLRKSQIVFIVSQAVVLNLFISLASAQDSPASSGSCDTLSRDGEVFNMHEDAVFSWIFPIRQQVALSSEFLKSKGDLESEEKLRLLCKGIDEVDALTYKVTETDFERKKTDASIMLYRAIYACSTPLLNALKQEISACSDNEKYLRLDIEKFEKLVDSVPKSIELLKTGVNPDQPLKNFSNEQIKQLVDSGNLNSVASEEPYYSVLLVGATLMPKYDSEGNNEGFKQSSFFGMLKLENRWPLWRDVMANHLGIDAAFYSAPIKNCEKQQSTTNPPSEASEEQQAACTEGEKDISNLKFNDVSNTLNASIYSHFLFNMPGEWELGPGFRYGVVSREKIAENGDSISGYYLVGIELALNDFIDHPNVKYLSGLPRFSFNISAGENEDFAGLGIRSTRYVTTANYRVYENQPIFVSLLVNEGKGPDSVALNVSYGFVASKILGIFSK